MIRHYLRVAWRQAQRQASYAAIHLVGLSVGMAACVWLALYVVQERSYDAMHQTGGLVYRVIQPGAALSPPSLGPTLANTYPQVLHQARVLPTLGEVLIRAGQAERFYESRFYWADSSILRVFNFPLVSGNDRALAATDAVVLSEAMAQKYFGAADPIGQRLVFDVGQQVALTVAGVMANPPPNSHFRPDFLASMQAFERLGFVDFNSWQNRLFHTYVKLAEAQDAVYLDDQWEALRADHPGIGDAIFSLQPITAIHLHSQLVGELEPAGSAVQVYLFAAIAVLILGMACANYINLATARAIVRSREIGVRKVLGATRRQLMRQFLGESVGLALLAAVLAGILVWATMPLFTTWFDLSLANRVWSIAGGIFGLALLVGGGVGSYPALLLSAFAPVSVLGGQGNQGPQRAGLRKSLVVFQFALSMMLVVGAWVVVRQMAYAQTHRLGFESAQTIAIAARTYGHAERPLPYESLQQEIAQHPDVWAVAATGDVPGRMPQEAFFVPEGTTAATSLASAGAWSFFTVDYGAIETLGLPLVQGEAFDRARPGEAANGILINEAGWARLRAEGGAAWTNPLGKQLDRYLWGGEAWFKARENTIIGVVEDFHVRSLHHAIEPMVIQYSNHRRDYLLVRVAAADPRAVIAHLEAVWSKQVPERPFVYHFLDAAFEAQYQAEARTSTLMQVFTGISLLIAGLGLLGLAAFSTAQRRKEVGVRKVVGASNGQVILLFLNEFAALIAWAAALAIPVAWWAGSRWLGQYAYHTTVSGGMLVGAVGLVALLVSAVVGYQAYRAASTRPVEVLRQN